MSLKKIEKGLQFIYSIISINMPTDLIPLQNISDKSLEIRVHRHQHKDKF